MPEYSLRVDSSDNLTFYATSGEGVDVARSSRADVCQLVVDFLNGLPVGVSPLDVINAINYSNPLDGVWNSIIETVAKECGWSIEETKLNIARTQEILVFKSPIDAAAFLMRAPKPPASEVSSGEVVFRESPDFAGKDTPFE